MSHCTNPTLLERVSDADLRGNAEGLAEHRAGAHPATHVHYDIPSQAFTVVAPQGGASE